MFLLGFQVNKNSFIENLNDGFKMGYTYSVD